MSKGWQWQPLVSDLLLERLCFEHPTYPVVNLQILICWREFEFVLVEFLVCRKPVFLKLLLFQIRIEEANICMWSAGLNSITHTQKPECCGINMIVLQQKVDFEINF